MKKFIALVLVIVLSVSFAACGKSENNIVKSNLKETVSTDIVDFTLENCEFAHYVSNVSTNYVEPTEEPNTMFAARTGTCFVSMTVTINNKDRGGNIDFGGSFGRWDPASWKVKYNGETYDMYGFDLNVDNYRSISLSYAALVDKSTGKVISKVGSNNKLIDAGESVTIRMFGIIHVDPTSLKDTFDLEISVPNSTGEYETFLYTIPAKA